MTNIEQAIQTLPAAFRKKRKLAPFYLGDGGLRHRCETHGNVELAEDHNYCPWCGRKVTQRLKERMKRMGGSNGVRIWNEVRKLVLGGELRSALDKKDFKSHEIDGFIFQFEKFGHLVRGRKIEDGTLRQALEYASWEHDWITMLIYGEVDE